MCPANGPRQTLTSVTLKSCSNKKPGYDVKHPLKILDVNDKNLELIQSLVQEL
jgi:hypothetical protein